MCDYGYGAVTPCIIQLGTKELARGVIANDDKYYITSKEYGFNKALEHRYGEALSEASEILKDMLGKN